MCREVGDWQEKIVCFEVGVIYNRRQPSAGVSKVGGQEREMGDETAAANIFFANLQGTSV